MRECGNPCVPMAEHQVIGYHTAGLGQVLILCLLYQRIGYAHDHEHILQVRREEKSLNILISKRELPAVLAIGIHAENLLHAFAY